MTEPPSDSYEPPYEPPYVPSSQPPPPRAQPIPPPPPYEPFRPNAPVPQGVAAPNRFKPLIITLVAIVAVLALGIGACTVWFVSTVTAPVDEANEFLADIDAGDYQAAAQHLDPACSAGLDANELMRIFGGANIDYDLTSSSVQGSSDAQVSGSFSFEDGSSGFDQIELFLGKPGDDWRVCGFGLS